VTNNLFLKTKQKTTTQQQNKKKTNIKTLAGEGN